VLTATELVERVTFLKTASSAGSKIRNYLLSLKIVWVWNGARSQVFAGTCPVSPALQAGSLPTGRQEGEQYERNFLCSHSVRH
jgi:hypothetical protein